MEMDYPSRGANPEELYRKENELYEKVWKRVTANQNGDNGMLSGMPDNTLINPVAGAAEQNTAGEAVKKPYQGEKGAAKEALNEEMKGATKKEAPKETVQEEKKKQMPQEAAKEAAAETKEAPKAAAKKETKEAAAELGKKAAKGETCLGPSSAVYGSQLQEAIMDELSDCEYYKRMARKFCRWSSTFLTLAAEEFGHAKRLSAAYFLISGICMQPVRHGKMAPLPSCNAALRKRYLAEQAGEETYLRMARETDDPCLRELYIQTAEGEREHAEIIRRLLECSIYP